MVTEADIADLMILARRGQLTGDQLMELESLLEASAELRTLYLAGFGFDDEGVLRPHDSDIVDAVVEHVTQGQTARRRETARLASTREAKPELYGATRALVDVGAAGHVASENGVKNLAAYRRPGARANVKWVGVGVFLASAVSVTAMSYPLMRSPQRQQQRAAIAHATDATSPTLPPGRLSRSATKRGPSPQREVSATDDREHTTPTTEQEPTSVTSAPTKAAAPMLHRQAQAELETASRASPSAESETASSPASLFESANAARRGAQNDEALRKYLLLGRWYLGNEVSAHRSAGHECSSAANPRPNKVR